MSHKVHRIATYADTPLGGAAAVTALLLRLLGAAGAAALGTAGAAAALGAGAAVTAAAALASQTALQFAGATWTKTSIGNGFLSNGNAKQGHKKEEKGQCSSLHHGSFVDLFQVSETVLVLCQNCVSFHR